MFDTFYMQIELQICRRSGKVRTDWSDYRLAVAVTEKEAMTKYYMNNIT